VARAVFLDRDGVINKKPSEGSYITCWENFTFLPRVVEAITRLNRAGFYVIVITNQRCVAKGLLAAAELEAIHQRMFDCLADRGAKIDAIYYCPHDVKPACRCRKPAPGMLIDAARRYGIELTASWMIGDSDTDIEAGKNAGCKTARLLAERSSSAGARRKPCSTQGVVANSLFDAVRQILENEARMQSQKTLASTSSA